MFLKLRRPDEEEVFGLSELETLVDASQEVRPMVVGVTARENNGAGYHAHVTVKKGGAFKRTNVAITYNPKDKYVYAYEHGDGKTSARVDIYRNFGKIVNSVREKAKRAFAPVSIRENCVPVPQGAVKLFALAA